MFDQDEQLDQFFETYTASVERNADQIAEMYFTLYEALYGAGFTTEQAMQLLCSMDMEATE